MSTALVVGVLVLAVAGSLESARATADRIAGVPEGVAMRGATHLWHLQRAGWPSARWVWAVNYRPAAANTFAEAQVDVSVGGVLVDEYNVAALGPLSPNDR